MFCSPGRSIGLGSRPVGGVGIFELPNCIGKINRRTKGESEAFMEPLQGSPTGIDTLPKPNIAPPVFNNIKVLLKAWRPGNGPIVERAKLGFNKRSDSIKSRVEGIISNSKGS